jgi:alkane 1-monooxygenase
MTENIEKPDAGVRLVGGSILATRAANYVRYSLMNVFIIIGTLGMAYGGLGCWTGLLLSFILIGFVDELFGDAGNKELMPPVWYMQLMLYLTLPLLLVITVVGFNVASQTGFAWVDEIFRFFGFDPVAARARTISLNNHGAWVSIGMFYGAAGVNVAHELIHRTDKPWDHLFGRWLLAFTWDTGFSIEHVYGHHKNVGTLADPATAKRGEYIWAFVVRSTIGQWISALKFENDRLKRRGIPNLPWTNRFWRGQAMTAAVMVFYCLFLGWEGILVFVYTGALGKVYLELVNYIEHYGLVRVPGTRVEHRHSWDSYRRVTSGMFYNLMLHSNHHKIATRRYWELEQNAGEAPLWPVGYMATIFIAMVPYYWKRYTEPLLAEWDRRMASPEERELLRERGLLLG